MGILIFLLFLGLLIYGVSKNPPLKTILGNKYHLLDHMAFSSQQFYSTVEEMIRDKELQKVQLSRITYSERGIFSAKREYLRVQYQNYVFDICAAPFAKNFFVSWWFSELGTPLHDFFKKVPLLGALMNKRPKTFFELDTENMIKESILSCVNSAIAQVGETKGVRVSTLLN